MPDSIIKANSISALDGGGIGIPDGSVSSPGLKFTNDGDTGLYRIGNNTIGIASNGSRVGEIGNGYGGFTGNIIQVQSTTKSDTYSTANTSYEDIPNFSCSITPRYSTSKVLVLVDIGGLSANNGTVYTRLVRGSTEIYSGDGSGGVLSQIYDGGNSTGEHYFGVWHHGATYLDSPVTTSVTTYKVQIKAQSGVTVYFNRNTYDAGVYNGRTASSITLMELQQ